MVRQKKKLSLIFKEKEHFLIQGEAIKKKFGEDAVLDWRPFQPIAENGERESMNSLGSLKRKQLLKVSYR